MRVVCGAAKKPATDCLYIQSIKFADLYDLEKNGVSSKWLYIDPGRCDLLYIMREASTHNVPLVACYTSCQRNKELCLCHFDRIRCAKKGAFSSDDVPLSICETFTDPTKVTKKGRQMLISLRMTATAN
ncbi:hypothetical protein GGI20_000559 [Coemansia sp. BCRC 34301]|nr:hypothetical protein GGI20_000559 [Coemansia sp. BCRC 34301]